jgi:hypothetical protein
VEYLLRGKILKTARKPLDFSFRQVSIDSIFFRGTLGTQAQIWFSYRFLAEFFQKIRPMEKCDLRSSSPPPPIRSYSSLMVKWKKYPAWVAMM